MGKLKTHKVWNFIFHKKMQDLSPNVHDSIVNFIEQNRGNISHYEYARKPGHRIYKVVLRDGDSREWEVNRVF